MRLARNTDPRTSHEAARKLSPATVKKDLEILRVIKSYGADTWCMKEMGYYWGKLKNPERWASDNHRGTIRHWAERHPDWVMKIGDKYYEGREHGVYTLTEEGRDCAQM